MTKLQDPVYVLQGRKEICTNPKEILSSIKTFFPCETYESIAKRANVHTQTIQRWSSIGRADSAAIKLLLNSFDKNDDFDSVLLVNATAKQLKQQCQNIGWDKIINA